MTSTATNTFLAGWEKYGLAGSDITTEHRFHAVRKWRWDVCWPSLMVAVELDGFGYGHQSVVGRRQDNEKQNAGVILGWLVLRYTTRELVASEIENTIEQVNNVLVTRGNH